MTRLMIYGATGYTGRMAAADANSAGLDLILAGRDETRLAELGRTLSVEHRRLALDDDTGVGAALRDVEVLLNCAGPFLRTADPLMRGAIRAGVHYLDIAAELDSYRLAETYDAQARATGVMLLPGSGGSVAMLGSLAGRAAERVGRPHTIRVALHVAGAMSRGSAISAHENLTAECLERVGGVLQTHEPGITTNFDFGSGSVPCFPVTLPDLVTLWRALRAPNIATFVHVSGSAFPTGDLDTLPDGPSTEEREANRYQASIEVTGAGGETVRAILDTVNGYSFTPLAAAEAARRVLAGEARPGFQTPAELFGNGFAETIADTTIQII
ncbi:saccharopine dehydrogenase family protein [Teichococcus vastitatis]|uniref:Saccharopine dehydrogenase NADP-binding domain-containing protein n=1 Tax=Teichococcus vastitatis TaxID=2307076 RepID=A0ABS9W6X2_9PROT|nr:saccharopine dehydrogenase NADP-binding domain-containing protein [Pseudoroseomonas vastitatis]MCI0755043.1 saccharopine dehydrogenase NADP-binding domain-containing protein [Pseudoroseomonas vastitatis]